MAQVKTLVAALTRSVHGSLLFLPIDLIRVRDRCGLYKSALPARYVRTARRIQRREQVGVGRKASYLDVKGIVNHWSVP